MDAVYEKLLEMLKTMTPEQEEAEWEELKEFNFGPTMEEYEQLVFQYQTTSLFYSPIEYKIKPLHCGISAKDSYYLAA